jgi:transcriptional regulator with XRE-family HTH domain
LLGGVTASLRAKRPEVVALEGESLGKQLQRRRRELGLQQVEVAAILGCHPKSILLWERDERVPADRMYPALIKHLGYEPWPEPQTLGERLRAERLRRGLSRKHAAEVIGVDEGTLWWWESGRWTPRSISVCQKIEIFLG